MKTFATVPVTVISSGAIRQPRVVQCRIASKRNLVIGFQHFIETAEWEKRYLCSRWIDKICIAGIVISVVFFATSFISFFLK